MWKVYILKSSKKRRFYVGSTNNIERRIKEHNGLRVSSTKLFAPLKLVHSIDFDSEKEARDHERKIKKQRHLKQKIIREL